MLPDSAIIADATEGVCWGVWGTSPRKMFGFYAKMGDSDSGIGIDSEITLTSSHFGIGNAGIGINQVFLTDWNRSRNQSFQICNK